MSQIIITMKLKEQKKNSVRYDAATDEGGQHLKSIYVPNAAIEALGSIPSRAPETLDVEIRTREIREVGNDKATDCADR